MEKKWLFPSIQVLCHPSTIFILHQQTDTLEQYIWVSCLWTRPGQLGRRKNIRRRWRKGLPILASLLVPSLGIRFHISFTKLEFVYIRTLVFENWSFTWVGTSLDTRFQNRVPPQLRYPPQSWENTDQSLILEWMLLKSTRTDFRNSVLGTQMGIFLRIELQVETPNYGFT